MTIDLLRAAPLVVASAVCVFPSGCKDKEAPTNTTSTATPLTGDGGSMASPLAVSLGKPVEGVLPCPGAPWFVVVPPQDAQVKYELQIPQGASQHCTHLNARDKAGKLLDSTVSLCSDNPAAFAEGRAPFGKDVTFFMIDQNDPNAKCVPAKYRLTVLGPK